MTVPDRPNQGGLLVPGLLDAVAPQGVEDFTTNALCWLLSSVPGLGPAFLDFLADSRPVPGGRPIPKLDDDRLVWDTQTSFWREGEWPVRPDMTCSDGTKGIVFEHKTGTGLRNDQLANYRRHAPPGFRKAPIVLITAHRGQHAQHPDLALCWSQLHAFLDGWVAPGDAGYAIREFQTLLAKRGLGPMEKLSIDDIRSFRPLERKLESILTSVAQRKWNEGAELKVKSKWGRVGFMVRGTWRGVGNNWDPGVFVGVMLDGWDHCTWPSHPDRGPDACVIVSVHEGLHVRAGQEIPACRRLADRLDQHPQSEWQIYRHGLDRNVSETHYGAHHGPNPWHPLHVRRPLANVLGDGGSGELQAHRLYEQLRGIVALVLDKMEAPW